MRMRRVRHGSIYGGRKEVLARMVRKKANLLAPRFEIFLKYCTTTSRSDVTNESGENV
jgi:hypothetical protein